MEKPTTTEQKKPDQKPAPGNEKNLRAVMGLIMLEAGLEFAMYIALPLLGAIYGGRWLDARLHVKFFVPVGILFAVPLTAFIIYFRAQSYKRFLK